MLEKQRQKGYFKLIILTINQGLYIHIIRTFNTQNEAYMTKKNFKRMKQCLLIMYQGFSCYVDADIETAKARKVFAKGTMVQSRRK